MLPGHVTALEGACSPGVEHDDLLLLLHVELRPYDAARNNCNCWVAVESRLSHVDVFTVYSGSLERREKEARRLETCCNLRNC